MEKDSPRPSNPNLNEGPLQPPTSIINLLKEEGLYRQIALPMIQEGLKSEHQAKFEQELDRLRQLNLGFEDAQLRMYAAMNVGRKALQSLLPPAKSDRQLPNKTVQAVTREAARLRDQEGLNTGQIALRLGRSPKTIRKYLRLLEE
ncbi:MAG: hypothetical protein HYW45_03325 [Candidatus Daviesbacteria bacterium]|nr:MAG: hypothetical protein HYW45_03325 [Candidatus Daviesbacteria bacterium]